MSRLTRRITARNEDVVYTKGYYENTTAGEMKSSDVREVMRKLADYEDLEEQGLLLKLPCKVDDTLYFVSRNKIIEELIVLKITYQDKFIITFRDESNDIGNVSEKYIGKTVFLTKEEAEEKLKELNISERN